MTARCLVAAVIVSRHGHSKSAERLGPIGAIGTIGTQKRCKLATAGRRSKGPATALRAWVHAAEKARHNACAGIACAFIARATSSRNSRTLRRGVAHRGNAGMACASCRRIGEAQAAATAREGCNIVEHQILWEDKLLKKWERVNTFIINLAKDRCDGGQSPTAVSRG